MPKIDLDKINPKFRTSYPGKLKAATAGYKGLAVGDTAGLTQFGVNQVVLAPGSSTALRHWHENEDEFVIILHGTGTLIEDTGETILNSGCCAGFPAGKQNGHCIKNLSAEDLVLIEIGTRMPNEVVHYPNVDLKLEKQAGVQRFVHKDGSSF